jgi:hypothetical protein
MFTQATLRASRKRKKRDSPWSHKIPTSTLATLWNTHDGPSTPTLARHMRGHIPAMDVPNLAHTTEETAKAEVVLKPTIPTNVRRTHMRRRDSATSLSPSTISTPVTTCRRTKGLKGFPRTPPLDHAFSSASSPQSSAQHSPRQVWRKKKTIDHRGAPPLRMANYCAGICSRHGCQDVHDTDKQALCKRWLYKGECPKGDSCPLSHEPSPHNSPTCQHFQDSRCNNDKCRWSHVRINPAAPTCEAFGTMGYCEKGDGCSDLHARECPTFSNTGHCRYGDKCRLGHVHRASRMRKTARLSSDGLSSEGNTPKEVFDDSTDSETWTGGAAHDPHQFSQQVDFVSLNAED